MKYSRLLLLGTCLLTSFALGACKKKTDSHTAVSSGNYTGPVTKGDWLVMQVDVNPDSMSPILSTDAYAQQIYPYIFDALIQFDARTGEPTGRLAESWTISKDGKTYDFYLRKNAVWHDGKPVTAEDVKFTFDAIKDPKVDAAHLQNYFNGLVKTEAVDTHHVRCHMKEVYFRNLITLGDQQIMPKHIYGVGDFNKNPAQRKPVGSGPYEFVKWDTGRLIELKRTKNFWGDDLPYWKERFNFDRILFRVITESSVAVMALKKGDVDSIMDPTLRQFISDFDDAETEKNFYKVNFDTADGDGFGYIGWNLTLPLFSQKEVRQALAMAMPRDEINAKIYKNQRRLSVGQFPKASPKTDPNLQPVAYDLAKAKNLLETAGWKDTNGDGVLDKNGKKFAFELLFPAGNPDGERIALIFQQSLKQIGVEMNLKTLEWTVYLKQIDALKFDGLMMAWGSSLDSDPYQIWHSSQTVTGGSNRIQFKNKRVDEILETARQTLDTKKRNALYQEFTRIVADEAPYLFLFERPKLLIVTKRFQGVLPPGLISLERYTWFTPPDLVKYKDAANP